MSWASAAAFVAGVLFVFNKFHYRPHLNSFGEMRGKIYELYSSRRLSCTSGYRAVRVGYWVPPPGMRIIAFPTPILPEVSEARKATTCSPGARWVNFTVNVSFRESTMPSSDRMSCQSLPVQGNLCAPQGRRTVLGGELNFRRRAADRLLQHLDVREAYCRPRTGHLTIRTSAPSRAGWIPHPTPPAAPHICRPPESWDQSYRWIGGSYP